ncbi:hypothetical protein BD311DRAFT_801015 [Dichomitus squalens]|uniref:Uncharacterized protein n=1 Tax=Dichomitus squalens TaxID=114155 RepID=A0A4Q9M581_9APHY|nr:hypothetical protein BD311DRAFT_801015 [Dichomitus squalens]
MMARGSVPVVSQTIPTQCNQSALQCKSSNGRILHAAATLVYGLDAILALGSGIFCISRDTAC